MKIYKFIQLLKQNFLGYLPIILFLGKHIECIQSKLSSACYAMRSVKPYVSLNTLKIIYYSYFHFVMTYGLLFWGHSSDSIKIFRLQKKIIRINIGCRSSDSCRFFFFFLNLEIIPLPSITTTLHFGSCFVYKVTIFTFYAVTQ